MTRNQGGERPEAEGTPEGVAGAAGEGSAQAAEAAAQAAEAAAQAAEAAAQAAEAAALQEDDLAGLSVDELKERVREARKEAQRNWQHFLHSAADLENYKKQAARDRQGAVERARRQMLGLVLGVLDNLERALAFGEGQNGTGKAVADGLRMTHRQILDQLAALGVRPIHAIGKRFDPRLHEAVGVVPPQDEQQAGGTVVGEVLKGYLLNEDVLRPAKVTVVAEQPGGESAEGSDAGRNR